MKIILMLINLSSLLVFYFNPANAAVFGTDDRKEMYEVNDFWQKKGESVAIRLGNDRISPTSEGFKLSGAPLGKRVCSTDRFVEQITVSNCTGFLIETGNKDQSDILLTAWHCMKSEDICKNNSWVFEYKLKNQNDNNYTKVSTEQVYHCKKILEKGSSYQAFGEVDYALIQLDRPVKNRVPLQLGFDLSLEPNQTVVSISNPNGLPQKFTPGKIIKLSDSQKRVSTDVDSFQGSSGGPLFDEKTGLVIAITSNGHSDHHHKESDGGTCRETRVCLEGDNCLWSDASRVTNIKDHEIFKK